MNNKIDNKVDKLFLFLPKNKNKNISFFYNNKKFIQNLYINKTQIIIFKNIIINIKD